MDYINKHKHQHAHTQTHTRTHTHTHTHTLSLCANVYSLSAPPLHVFNLGMAVCRCKRRYKSSRKSWQSEVVPTCSSILRIEDTFRDKYSKSLLIRRWDTSNCESCSSSNELARPPPPSLWPKRWELASLNIMSKKNSGIQSIRSEGRLDATALPCLLYTVSFVLTRWKECTWLRSYVSVGVSMWGNIQVNVWELKRDGRGSPLKLRKA